MNGPDHITKMATTRVYDKNFQNIYFQNRKSYDLETRVVKTVHLDEPIRLQDFSTNQIQGLRSRSQRF